jgi:hypothetical protein
MPTSVSPNFVNEQQGNPRHRDERAPGEALAGPVSQQQPTEQARRNQKEREDRGDHARGDVPLREIDGVEVHAELREAEEDGGEQALSANVEAIAFPAGQCRHRQSGDREAIRH